MLFFGKRKNGAKPRPNEQSSVYIQEIRHSPRGLWHRYDILLAVRGYGWETMVDWAEYYRRTDLYRFSTIIVTEIAGGKETELKDEYQKHLGSLKGLPSLSREHASLSIGGFSHMLRCPMKITWFNQTRALRLLTTESDEARVRSFAEALVQRRFGSSAL